MKFKLRKAQNWYFFSATDKRCNGIAAVPDTKGGQLHGQKSIKNVCGNLIATYDDRRKITRITGLVVREEAQRGKIDGVKIATKLYEMAAQYSCKRHKVPLASDVSRSDRSDGFWKKQVAKGRATWMHFGEDADFDTRGVLTCPAPKSLARYLRKKK